MPALVADAVQLKCIQLQCCVLQDKVISTAPPVKSSAIEPVIAVGSQQQSVQSSSAPAVVVQPKTHSADAVAGLSSAHQAAPISGRDSPAEQEPEPAGSADQACNIVSGHRAKLISHQLFTAGSLPSQETELAGPTDCKNQAGRLFPADQALLSASASPISAAAPLELPGALDPIGPSHQVAQLQATIPLTSPTQHHTQVVPQPSQKPAHAARKSLESLPRTPPARPPLVQNSEALAAAPGSSITRHASARQSQASTAARRLDHHTPALASAQQPGMHRKLQNSSIQDLQHVVCPEMTSAAAAAAAAAAKGPSGDGRPPTLRRSSSGSNVKANVHTAPMSGLASAGRSQSLTDTEAINIQPRAEEAVSGSPQQGVPVYVMLPLDTVRLHLALPGPSEDACTSPACISVAGLLCTSPYVLHRQHQLVIECDILC